VQQLFKAFQDQRKTQTPIKPPSFRVIMMVAERGLPIAP
jgi:hypothetical protein